MKTKIPALVLFIFAFINASAQLDSWNAKIMLHSVTGKTDTLWIGCDENGGWGYQPGLDAIDTTLTYPGIWGYDSLIAEGECFNLKKDVKEFVTGIQKFNIQIADSFPQTFPYDYLTIDTNEFKFDNGQFKLTFVYLKVNEGGYINCIDCDGFYIYSGIDTIFNQYNYFYFDSISLIFEPNLFNCLQIDNNQMRLQLEIGFNYYLSTGIRDLNTNKSTIFPNPANKSFYVFNSSQYKSLEVYDLNGKKVLNKSLNHDRQQQIDISNLKEGLYIALLVPIKEFNPVLKYKISIF